MIYPKTRNKKDKELRPCENEIFWKSIFEKLHESRGVGHVGSKSGSLKVAMHFMKEKKRNGPHG